MSVTLIVFAATRLAVLKFLRPHFLAALHRTVVATDSGRAVGDWVLSDTLVDAGGQNITAAREDLAILHAQQAGIDPHEYLVTLGWRRTISYQPEGRFWTFQLLEAGLFVLLALLVIATAVGSCAAPRHDRRAPRPGAGAAARGLPPLRLRRFRPTPPRPSPGRFPQPHPRWRLVFVNHALTNPFFVPAMNGSADACQAARDDVRVDRLGEQRRRRDGEGDAARDQHARRRDRAVDHRPLRLRRADRRRPRAGHPGRGLQRRRRQGEQAARLHRPGSVRVRSRVRRPHRRSRRERRRLHLHRDARASRTSSRASTARSTRFATPGGRSTSRSSRRAST